MLMRLRANGQTLIAEVWDAAPAPPEPRPHTIDAQGGRGLEIVSLLSEAWGYYPEYGGKVVCLTLAKRTPDRAWLTEVSAAALQQALADLNTAYRNYFASLSGNRHGPKMRPPRLRSRKDHRQTVRFTANARFRVLPSGKLRLPKIGDVPVRWSRPLPSRPSSVTMIKDAAGRHFASFVVEAGPRSRPATGPAVGIDLGLTHFAVLSDGTKIASPQFLRRAEKKLKRTQRNLSRKEKGSKNRDKARVKAARAHASVADARREFHHHFHRIDRFEPTSQTCSACGTRDGPTPLSVRAWRCRGCAAWLDRDVNAAVNVAKAAGLAVTACGAQVRPEPVPAQRSRNPPEVTSGSGVTGGNPRHSGQGGSQKGIVAWKEWPSEPWLETAEAKDRIAGFLRAARPLAN